MTEPDAVVARDLLDEPHVAGRRVPVRALRARVEEHGDGPTAVADRFDLDPATVYRALAYYHENSDLFARAHREREATYRAFREARAAAGCEEDVATEPPGPTDDD